MKRRPSKAALDARRPLPPEVLADAHEPPLIPAGRLIRSTPVDHRRLTVTKTTRKKHRNMTQRIAVQCIGKGCTWRGQRTESSIAPCPECGGRVAPALPRQRGRPPLPPEEQRVDLHPRVLKSTAEALGEGPSRMAAQILDAMFAKKRRGGR